MGSEPRVPKTVHPAFAVVHPPGVLTLSKYRYRKNSDLLHREVSGLRE
jgi:hypothetical protein